MPSVVPYSERLAKGNHRYQNHIATSWSGDIFYIYILLVASTIILKEWFSLCAQQKRETEKQMQENIMKQQKHLDM